MSDSYRALCSDFYINQKIAVKLDLPRSRESGLELFERIRREFPGMSAFRRYKEELALESPQSEAPHRWLAVRTNSVRSGVVNPTTDDQAFGLHRRVLEVAPYFLSISPLDIDYVELLFGFDLEASGSHDRIVAEALYADSPLAGLADGSVGTATDCQPLIGLTVDESTEIEAHFEVKTRSASKRVSEQRDEPISVYLTMRQYRPVTSLDELQARFDTLALRGLEIVDERVVTSLLLPLRQAIASRSS
ncbi:MAG: hypothetical protein DHS20C14_09380 [Phycisphaeraceae bacterium]|nr:MAG: hypothetical protein DHS20C14_09380 [Phycisphaeraceae bacterium]